MGGKARGVAFMNAMISKAHMADKYEDMKVKVPRSFVIGSEVFEKFIEQNDLYSFISHNVYYKLYLNSFEFGCSYKWMD